MTRKTTAPDEDPMKPIPGSFAAALEDVRVELEELEAAAIRQWGKPLVSTVMWLARAIDRVRSASLWISAPREGAEMNEHEHVWMSGVIPECVICGEKNFVVAALRLNAMKAERLGWGWPLFVFAAVLMCTAIVARSLGLPIP